MTRSPIPMRFQEDVALESPIIKTPHTPFERQGATCFTPEHPERIAESPLQMTSLVAPRSPLTPAAAAPAHAPTPDVARPRTPTPPTQESRSPTPKEDRIVRDMQKKLEEAQRNALAAKAYREAERKAKEEEAKERKRQAATRWSAFAAKTLGQQAIEQLRPVASAHHEAKRKAKEEAVRLETERLMAEEHRVKEAKRLEAERKAKEASTNSARFLPGKRPKPEKVTGCDCFSFLRR